MQEPLDPLKPATVTCENCGNVNPDNQKFCSMCSFPVGGTEQDKTQFRVVVSSRKGLLKKAQEKMKTAKIIIYVLAGIVFLQGLYLGLANDDFVLMIVNLCICLLYLILAAWADKNPFGAILTAFIIYVTLIIVNAFLDPPKLFQGLLMKLFFVAAFVKGIRSAKDAQDHLEELAKVKAAPIGSN